MDTNTIVGTHVDEFSTARRAGSKAQIEDFLLRAPAELRSALLKALLEFELTNSSHQRRGDLIQEFLQRFPECGWLREQAATSATVSAEPLRDRSECATQADDALDDSADLTLTFLHLNTPLSPANGSREVSLTTSATLAPTRGNSEGFLIGSVIAGRFHLQRVLGEGGMGKVFLGKDVRLDRPVAIKTIRDDRFSNQGVIDSAVLHQFEEEAKIGAGLVHSAIAAVYDYGFHNGTAFTVFEYVAGDSMRDLIIQRAPLPLEDVRRIVATMSQALDYAHAQGIVHRDLKPENVRITEQGQPKILDLGLAQRFQQSSDRSFAGTPAYASPEQVQEHAADGRTDQYALAVIAYELLTGRRPFITRNWREMLEMHRSQQPESPQQFVADLPTSVADGILRALSKDPHDRFISCGEFAADIGSRFQDDVHRAGNVRLQAKVKRSGWKTRSSFSLTTRRSLMLCVALDDEALWIASQDGIERWPAGALKSCEPGKRAALILGLEWGTYRRNHTWIFDTVDECERWRQEMSVWSKDGASHPVPPNWSPEVPTAVLLASRPEIPCQVLGRLEVQEQASWLADLSLQLAATMRGANGVVEVHRERLAFVGRTTRRCQGIAISTNDKNGREELAAKWFGERIAHLCFWITTLLIVVTLLRLGGHFFFAAMQSEGRGGLATAQAWGPLASSVMLASWPLLCTILLWFTKLPQLVNATALAFLSVALAPIAMCVSLVGLMLLWGIVPNAFLGLILASFFDPANLAIMIAGVWISRRLWQSATTFNATVGRRDTRWQRHTLQIGATTISILFLMGMLGFTVFGAYELASSALPGKSDLASATVAMQRGDNARAEPLLMKSIAAQPTAEAYVNLAKLFADKGDTRRCIEFATKAIELKPDLSLAYVNRSMGHFNHGAYDAVIADCTRAIELNPKETMAYVNRSAAYLRKNDPQLALADSDRAIALDSQNPLPYLNRGVARLMLNDLDGSIGDGRKLLELNSHLAQAKAHLAMAYTAKAKEKFFQKNYQEAIEAATLAIETGSPAPEAEIIRTAAQQAKDEAGPTDAAAGERRT